MAELLTRTQILEAEDLEREVVPVPEWGGSVLIRGLTGRERDAFEVSIVRMQGGAPGAGMERSLQNIRARLVAMSAIDESGARLFEDRDVRALGEKSAAALDRLFDVARRLSGLSEGEVQEMAEDFGGGPSGDSGSI
jgi:hypothetical protein